MLVKKLDSQNKKILLTEIVVLLKKGGVVVLPTDTVYGLSCSANDAMALTRICEIKERDKKKSFILLVSSLAMAKKYCFVNKQQAEILKELWINKKDSDRPVSAILKSRKILPESLEVSGSLALRLPRNNFLLSIIKKVGAPIVSTSLNISGEKTLKNINNIKDMFNKLPDLVIDGGVISGRPSRIADLRDPNALKFLR